LFDIFVFAQGQVKAGTSSAIRLTQGGHVKITFKTDSPLPVQVKNLLSLNVEDIFF
jgi:hypothetical protein